MPDRFSISDVAPACWRLGRHFDLVFLTGHAFQVFLTDDDQRAVLSTIAEHLASGGRFIFDTRSPAAQAWREWTPMPSMRRFDHPSLGPVEAWNDIGHDATTGSVTYQTRYRVDSSEQHFPPHRSSGLPTKRGLQRCWKRPVSRSTNGSGTGRAMPTNRNRRRLFRSAGCRSTIRGRARHKSRLKVMHQQKWSSF